MKIYFDKIKVLLKQQRLSYSEFCKLADIGRTTFYDWRSGKRIPREGNIRAIAHFLNVGVEEISDLPPDQPISDIDITDSGKTWLELSRLNEQEINIEYTNIISKLIKLNSKMSEASIILNGLLSSINTIFYVKDINLKYIVANDAFLDNLFLSASFKVLGKKDSDFFNNTESNINTEQDTKILLTGQAIESFEQLIPGSRKKKWGIISKYPIKDSNNKILGVIGVFTDITQRKMLSNVQDLLFHALNISDDVFTLDILFPEPKNIFISKSIEKILGYPSEDILNNNGQLFKDSIHPDDFEKLYPFFLNRDKAVKEGNDYPKHIQYRIRDSKGIFKWIDEQFFHYTRDGITYNASLHRFLRNIKDSDTDIITQDITERKIKFNRDNQTTQYDTDLLVIAKTKEIAHKLRSKSSKSGGKSLKTSQKVFTI
jgi:PAS domain-containing protein